MIVGAHSGKDATTKRPTANNLAAWVIFLN
jgi:hypothetical protein